MVLSALVTGQDVVDSALATLTAYLPNVLGKLTPVLPVPASVVRPSPATARLDAAAMPLLSVSVIGTEGSEAREGGFRRVSWSLDVLLAHRAEQGTFETNLRDGYLYAAAISTVLLERPQLGGLAYDVHSLAESYDDADPSAGRSFSEVHVTGIVEVVDARRRQVKYTLPGPVPVDSVVVTGTATVHRSTPAA